MTGLRFRETMTGRIALRARDPMDGYGRVDGYAAVMHITIDIPDVAAFTAGRVDAARLRADVLIPVLGGRFQTSGGEFVCFRSGEGSDGTPVQQMIYTATLTNDDRVLEMSARKVLEPRGWRIWRVWPDTTTLLVTLVDVTPDDDKERPRHLAGVVLITVRGFARQLTTMRPYGSRRWSEKLGALFGYLSFFAGRLIRIYLWRRMTAE
ncbi:hypothetical protein [Mycolicibacterium gilvum]|uniref:hypothetical protein n=1 Tax=Mycolicibacterium gilvum TaxID=1804 RepID=UPI000C1B1250